MSEEKEIDGFKAKELILSGLITSSDIKGSILYDEAMIEFIKKTRCLIMKNILLIQKLVNL